MIHLNAALAEQTKIVLACAPAALTTTAGDGDYVSMKGYDRLSIIIAVDNATTVTGGAITLIQAKEVAGTTTKALAFAGYWANTDTGAADTLTYTAATSDTFTTSTTDNKNQLFVIEVTADMLDGAAGYDCVRVDSASMANAVGSIVYILRGARYAGTTPLAAITD
jgi:hypothetical protein